MTDGTKVPGVTGVWSLRVGLKTKDDDILVVAYFEKTQIFSTHGYPLPERSFEDLQFDSQTLNCGNVSHMQIIQITTASVRLVNRKTRKISDEWVPPMPITACNFNPTQIVYAR